MKNIREFSEESGISKVSIYNKIKHQLNDELKYHIFKNKGQPTLIDETGQDIIIKSINKDKITQLEYINKNSSNKNKDKHINLKHIYSKNLNDNKDNLSLINTLKEQLHEKDKQIKEILDINIELIKTIQDQQKIQLSNNILTLNNNETDKTKKTFFNWFKKVN